MKAKIEGRDLENNTGNKKTAHSFRMTNRSGVLKSRKKTRTTGPRTVAKMQEVVNNKYDSRN
mgnify:CR=1 FL=1